MKACWPDDGPNACAATPRHTGRSIERHRAGVADVHRHLAIAIVADSRNSGHRRDPEQQMNRVLSGLVTSVAAARNLVVVHTPSGAAQYVASVVDKQPIDGVLGTIAGDDTVMVICADDDYAKQRAQWLLDVVSKG